MTLHRPPRQARKSHRSTGSLAGIKAPPICSLAAVETPPICSSERVCQNPSLVATIPPPTRHDASVAVQILCSFPADSTTLPIA